MAIVSRIVAGTAVMLLLAAAHAGARLSSDDARVATAAERQEWELLRALIEASEDVTVAQPDGATALHWVSYWDNVSVAEDLIGAGANIDALTDLGIPPLWIAVESGSIEMALYLIGAGAGVNGRLPTGETMLMMAAQNGLRNVVSQLLERGADARLTEHQAGQTALMWAAAGGHVDVVRLLAESGIDIHARSAGKFTALMFAARAGDLESVQLLLDAGANLEAKSIDRSTPLLIASRSIVALGGIDWRIISVPSGHEETAHRLIDRGAEVTATDQIGRTALHAAVETGRISLAQHLIGSGADVNARLITAPPQLPGDLISRNSFKGASPFWLAARDANLEMMRLLLDAGADPHLPNASGVTPLMIASGLGGYDARRPPDDLVVETATLLLERGADAAATDRSGQTALHGAASMWEDEVIQLLVDHGADVNAEDRRGRTPLYLVENRESKAPSESTAALLRTLGANEPVLLEER